MVVRDLGVVVVVEVQVLLKQNSIQVTMMMTEPRMRRP
jgi:hypothetical protein